MKSVVWLWFWHLLINIEQNYGYGTWGLQYEKYDREHPCVLWWELFTKERIPNAKWRRTRGRNVADRWGNMSTIKVGSSVWKTRPGGQRCVLKPLFSFFIFLQLFHFFTLLVAPSSFLLIAPSSWSLLPPRPSFFLVQHCLNHFESVKGHFSSIWTKALPTDQRTNQRTNQRTDGRTRPHIEMRGRI